MDYDQQPDRDTEALKTAWGSVREAATAVEAAQSAMRSVGVRLTVNVSLPPGVPLYTEVPAPSERPKRVGRND